MIQNGWLTPDGCYVVADDEPMNDVANQLLTDRFMFTNSKADKILSCLGYLLFVDDQVIYCGSDSNSIIFTQKQVEWIEQFYHLFSENQRTILKNKMLKDKELIYHTLDSINKIAYRVSL